MSVLFALSILAFAALLWAAISIAGVVRRSRRRARRRAAEADGSLPRTRPASATPFAALAFRELSTAPQTSSPAGEVSDPALPLAAQPEFLPPPPPAPRLAHREVKPPNAVIVAQPAETAEALPLAALAPPPPPVQGPPPRLRNFPTRLGKHPVAAGSPADAPPRWNPFSEDFGDLTDPAPSRRSRDPRSRNRV